MAFLLQVLPAQSYSVVINENTNYEEMFESIVDAIKANGFEIEGDFKFDGHHLRSKEAPKSKNIDISFDGVSSYIYIDASLEEGIAFANQNLGLLLKLSKSFDQSVRLVFTRSLYDWDGQGIDYQMNYRPMIILSPNEVLFTILQQPVNEDWRDYPYYQGKEIASADTVSRIIKPGQEYENHLILGSQTEVYSLGSKDYNAKGVLTFGYKFATNWGIIGQAKWQNRNDEVKTNSYTEQSGNISAELSQKDASVKFGCGFGHYAIESKPLGTYETGIFFPIILGGSWNPRHNLGFSGGVVYNVRKNRLTIHPPSTAEAEIRFTPYPWDILGNGMTNGYGLGAKTNVFIDNQFAIENISAFAWVGTGLHSRRFPIKELCAGTNYNAQAQRWGLYINLNFNLGVK